MLYKVTLQLLHELGNGTSFMTQKALATRLPSIQPAAISLKIKVVLVRGEQNSSKLQEQKPMSWHY